jgi:hypothetical protein
MSTNKAPSVSHTVDDDQLNRNYSASTNILTNPILSNEDELSTSPISNDYYLDQRQVELNQNFEDIYDEDDQDDNHKDHNDDNDYKEDSNESDRINLKRQLTQEIKKNQKISKLESYSNIFSKEENESAESSLDQALNDERNILLMMNQMSNFDNQIMSNINKTNNSPSTSSSPINNNNNNNTSNKLPVIMEKTEEIPQNEMESQNEQENVDNSLANSSSSSSTTSSSSNPLNKKETTIKSITKTNQTTPNKNKSNKAKVKRSERNRFAKDRNMMAKNEQFKSKSDSNELPKQCKNSSPTPTTKQLLFFSILISLTSYS